MSTEIKPGDEIVTIQDAPTLLGYALPKGTHGTVIRSGPPIVGPYSVYARFEGDRPGDGRQVRPGDVAVVPATPAPLDPKSVHVGDTVTVEVEQPNGDTYVVTGKANRTANGYTWVGPIRVDAGAIEAYPARITDHQPAPEPEPEWEMTQVAVVTPHWKDDLTTRAIYGEDGNWHNAYGGFWSDDEVSVRPLVVIDPAAVDVDHLVDVGSNTDDPRTNTLAILAGLGLDGAS